MHSFLKYLTYLQSSDLRLVTMSKRQGTDLRNQSISQSESTCSSRSLFADLLKTTKRREFFFFFAKALEFCGVFYDT